METKYIVTGMTCGHCVNAVKEEVGEINGVDDVQLELEGGEMTVTSANEIDFDAITEAVKEAGDYTVALA